MTALRAWANPENNPFLQRALRIETRKHKPLLTMAGISFCLGVALILTWWLWSVVSQLPYNGPNVRLQKWLFGVLSDNPINWLAIATAAISAYGVLWCARARSFFLLRQEVLKNTLVQLQQLPLAEERWIWLMASHPAMLGVLVGACGLPVYALAIFTGQWGALDVIGLMILFFLLGHAAPSWQLSQWQQSSAKQPPKTNWKQWQESLKIQRDAGASAEEKLEAGRRAERALSGESAEYSASSETKKLPLAGWLGNSGGKQNRSWSLFGWVWGISVFNGFASSALGIAGPLTTSWPREAAALLGALPVTWPLFFARMMFAPLDFFALRLPPFLLLIPLWIALNHQRFVSLASHVSAAETFWTPQRARRKNAVQLLTGAILLLCICGYGWPLWIELSLLARILVGAPVTPDWAEATFFTLMLIAATLGAGIYQEAPFKRARHAPEETSPREAFGQSLRIALGIPTGVLAVYFLFCWMGARSGLSTPTLTRAPLVAFTIIAFLLADFGSAAFGSILSGAKLRLWGMWRAVWFYWLAIAALVFIIRGFVTDRVFAFDDAPLVLLSPFVTLFSLLRFKVPLAPAANSLLWIALFVQAAIGIICLSLAVHALFFSSQSTPAIGEDTGESSSESLSLLEPLWKLGRAISAFLLRIIQAIINAIESFNALNLQIVRWGERWDNAVLTYELRRRVRKENWLAVWLLPIIGGLLFFITLARPWELWTSGVQGMNVGGLSGKDFFAAWGTQVSIVVFIAIWALGAITTTNIGRAFDADRANGTLVFLFLTPQTDAQILIGKLVSNLIFVAGWIWSGLIWLGIGVLAGTIFGEDKSLPFVVLSGVLALAASIAFIAATSLCFAIHARKPTEGQSRTLLFCACSQAITGLLFAAAIGKIRDALNWPSEIIACPALIVFALLHFALALGAWKWALRIFAKSRYGDVEASGKGAT